MFKLVSFLTCTSWWYINLKLKLSFLSFYSLNKTKHVTHRVNATCQNMKLHIDCCKHFAFPSKHLSPSPQSFKSFGCPTGINFIWSLIKSQSFRVRAPDLCRGRFLSLSLLMKNIAVMAPHSPVHQQIAEGERSSRRSTIFCFNRH